MDAIMKDTIRRLSKDAIREALAAPVRLETVDVPPLGGAVDLRFPTFAEWHSIALEHRRLAGAEPSAELIARTVAVVLANPDGTRMFTADEIDQVEAMPPAAVMELYVAAWGSVLRGPEATDEAKKD
jgi:hypothetical protein